MPEYADQILRDEATLASMIRSLDALLIASDALEEDAPTPNEIADFISSGLLRPNDNEQLAYWFARFLTVRQNIWEIIDDAIALGNTAMLNTSSQQDWKVFVVGYSAACLLIRNDRFMLFRVAPHSMIQRKLNEAFDEYRIPRKQYSAVFKAYVKRRDALKIYTAMLLARNNRDRIELLHDDPQVGEFAQRIPEFETWLDPSRRNYVYWLFAHLSHKWRRRGVVSISTSFARVVERFGRVASELRLPVDKRVTAGVRNSIAAQLRPGDVLITRHMHATTNLFLPGFWPHAALYIGYEADRDALGVNVDEARSQRWSGDACVLEALKDGVRFRPLYQTLAVDYVAILRPTIDNALVARGIERVVRHEGKLYNFDFDFFSSDRLVCSEVVYRAFDGLGTIEFPLNERAGRKTLSAEDLLHYALHSNGFSLLGIFGVGESEHGFVTGERAIQIALQSYESAGR